MSSLTLYKALIDAGIANDVAQRVADEVISKEDAKDLATKQYVAEKISAQTWQLVGFMVAQAALIVSIILTFAN